MSENELRAFLTKILDGIQALMNGKQDHFTPFEFGQQLTPVRAEFTVQSWCRDGRVNAKRMDTLAGPHPRWVLDKAEVARVKRDGLLPFDRNRNR
jgi:hypothetical protein